MSLSRVAGNEAKCGVEPIVVSLRCRRSSTSAKPRSVDVQVAKIAVTEKGFEPDKIRLRARVLARLTFVRTTDNTCGTEVMVPSLNTKRALPLNEPVVIEFTPATSEIAFGCA